MVVDAANGGGVDALRPGDGGHCGHEKEGRPGSVTRLEKLIERDQRRLWEKKRRRLQEKGREEERGREGALSDGSSNWPIKEHFSGTWIDEMEMALFAECLFA